MVRAACVLAACASVARAQSIEPRAYSNAPVGVNFLIAGYAYTRGGLSFDTSPMLSNPELTTSSAVAAYARTLDLGGMAGEFDLIVPYSWLSGSADYLGGRVERETNGFADPLFRLAVNFYGAPALTLPEFRSYQQDLIVGASLQVSAPAGQYDHTNLGRTFRLPGYLAVLEELYGKPFTRVSGRKLTGEGIPTGKELVLPFLGPGAPPAPVVVEGTVRYTGFERKGKQHLLGVSGKYEGQPDFSTGEGLAARLADFGKEAPKGFTAAGSASGHFQSSGDVLSGPETRSTGQLSYSAKWIFEGGSLTEEVAGKSILEPVE